eukprot:UN31245
MMQGGGIAIGTIINQRKNGMFDVLVHNDIIQVPKDRLGRTKTVQAKKTQKKTSSHYSDSGSESSPSYIKNGSSERSYSPTILSPRHSKKNKNKNMKNHNNNGFHHGNYHQSAGLYPQPIYNHDGNGGFTNDYYNNYHEINKIKRQINHQKRVQSNKGTKYHNTNQKLYGTL